MKYSTMIRRFLLGLMTLGLTTVLGVRGNAGEQMIFPFASLESQTNLVVLADRAHPQSSNSELTNVLSNTNLFSLSEQALLSQIKLKYKNVTTNSGPTGAVFKKWGSRQRQWKQISEMLRVACFSYTNSNDSEEVASPFGIDSYVAAKYRTPEGDGYNVIFMDGNLVQFQGYKKWKLDGVFLQMNSDLDDQHCITWTRFREGKAIGQFLGWDKSEIIISVTYKETFDLLKHAVGNFVMDWEEAESEKTNSIKK